MSEQAEIYVLSAMSDAAHRFLFEYGNGEAHDDLQKARTAVENLIRAAKNVQSRVAEGMLPDPEEWDWLDTAIAKATGETP